MSHIQGKLVVQDRTERILKNQGSLTAESKQKEKPLKQQIYERTKLDFYFIASEYGQDSRIDKNGLDKTLMVEVLSKFYINNRYDGAKLLHCFTAEQPTEAANELMKLYWGDCLEKSKSLSSFLRQNLEKLKLSKKTQDGKQGDINIREVVSFYIKNRKNHYYRYFACTELKTTTARLFNKVYDLLVENGENLHFEEEIRRIANYHHGSNECIVDVWSLRLELPNGWLEAIKLGNAPATQAPAATAAAENSATPAVRKEHCVNVPNVVFDKFYIPSLNAFEDAKNKILTIKSRALYQVVQGRTKCDNPLALCSKLIDEIIQIVESEPFSVKETVTAVHRMKALLGHDRTVLWPEDIHAIEEIFSRADQRSFHGMHPAPQWTAPQNSANVQGPLAEVYGQECEGFDDLTASTSSAPHRNLIDLDLL